VTNDLYKSVTVPSEEKLLLFRQLVGGAKIGNVTVTEAFGKVRKIHPSSYFIH
jgi:hypothetical protein